MCGAPGLYNPGEGVARVMLPPCNGLGNEVFARVNRQVTMDRLTFTRVILVTDSHVSAAAPKSCRQSDVPNISKLIFSGGAGVKFNVQKLATLMRFMALKHFRNLHF